VTTLSVEQGNFRYACTKDKGTLDRRNRIFRALYLCHFSNVEIFMLEGDQY